ncbi:MAG: MATE family efflux transporter [Faecalibacterium sp.]
MKTSTVDDPLQQIPELPEQKDLYHTAFHMAWPTMLESFLISMTGFVDTIMVSALGASAIAAIGLTDQPKFIGLCAFFAIATAISSICARRKGENDRDSANVLLRKMLFFGIVLCIIVSTILFFGADFILTLAGSQEDTHDLAVGYFRIIAAGMIFTAVTQILNAAQRGVGNTRISMITNTTANVVNVVFNYLLIGGRFGFPALGVNGAAIATVLGTAAGCAISIASALNPNSFIYLRYRAKEKKIQSKDLRATLDIGGSAFMEQVFLRIGFFLFALTVAKLGTIALSAHTIAMKILNLSFSLADGLSIASIALVGRSLGQKKPELARAYGTICRRIGVMCSVLISIVFLFFGKSLFALFTDEAVILDYSTMLIALLCVITYVQIAQVVTTGCLRGAGDTKFTAFTSLISVAIVRPLASWVLCYPCGLGLTGIWLGLLADQAIRFLFSFIRFRQGKWLNIKV